MGLVRVRECGRGVVGKYSVGEKEEEEGVKVW